MMRKDRSSTILLVASLAVVSAVAFAVVTAGEGVRPTPTRQRTPVLVGVLAEDGTLTPFAQYDNGGWFHPFPAPTPYWETGERSPASLRDLQQPWFEDCDGIPAGWRFWASPAAPTMLKGSAIVKVSNHSGSNWAIKTDYTPDDGTIETCRGIVGVALTSGDEVESVIDVNEDSDEVKNVTAFIVGSYFNDAERSAAEKAAAEAKRTGVPPESAATRERRAKAELRVTELYRTRSRIDGEYIYRFTAEKSYGQARHAGYEACDERAIYTGWLALNSTGGGGLIGNDELRFTDCDDKGSVDITPLGVVTLGATTYLFAVEHGWEDESYTIYDLKELKMPLLETFGG